MYKNSNGYMLLETMVAFSVLLLLTLHLFPLYTHIRIERDNQVAINTADRLLHEEILHYKYDGNEARNSKVTHNNRTYNLSWESSKQELKACIKWEDKLKRSMERCDYILK